MPRGKKTPQEEIDYNQPYTKQREVCKKCGASVDMTQALNFASKQRISMFHCPICGTIDFPDITFKELVIIEATEERKSILDRVKKQAVQYDSDPIEEIFTILEDYLNIVAKAKEKEDGTKEKPTVPA